MKFTNYLYVAGLAILFSCGKGNDDPGPEGPRGPQGADGLKSLLDIKPIAAGDKCSAGGLMILAGIDKNANNKLEENEVENTQYVCNGSNAAADKQIVLRLGSIGFPVGSNRDVTYYLSMPRFNINNYPGVDSVVLIAAPYNTTGGNSIVELIDFADKSVIVNSSVTATTTQPGATALISKNFYAGFPKKEFDLGVKVSTTTPNTVGLFYGDVLLILYRK